MKRNGEESLSTFTEYFKVLIDKLLDQNQTHQMNINSDDLTKTTKELVDFDEEFSIVIFYKIV